MTKQEYAESINNDCLISLLNWAPEYLTQTIAMTMPHRDLCLLIASFRCEEMGIYE